MESLKKFETYSLGSSLHSLEHAFTDFARVGCKGSVRHHTWKQGTAISGQRKLTITNIIFINAICKSMKQRNGLNGHGHYQTDHVLLVNKQKLTTTNRQLAFTGNHGGSLKLLVRFRC